MMFRSTSMQNFGLLALKFTGFDSLTLLTSEVEVKASTDVKIEIRYSKGRYKTIYM